MRGDLVKKLTLRCLAAGLAVLAFLALVFTAQPWALGLALAAVGAAWAERRFRPDVEQTAEPILLAAGVLVAYARQSAGGIDWALAVTGVALLGLILVERPMLAAAGLEIRAANLAVRSVPLLVAQHLGAVVLALLAGLAGCAAFALPTWPAMTVTLLVTAVVGGAVAALMLRRLKPSAARSPVVRALQRHQPAFLLHFSAPPGSEYQVTMWLPYLERLGLPFFVLVREPNFLPAISAATSAPVVHCPTFSALDQAIVPSVRAAFYVNHGAKNAHCVRFSQLTHVQLHHGDSDKASSANPASAIYDKIFVAGQAAIDRYARNGVSIPRDKFVIVGRPQVEPIVTTQAPVAGLTDPVVLYAPTWTGHYSDANYCSLPVGGALVERLLARGVTVILRAHPYTAQNPESARQLARIEELLSDDRAATGRPHVWGAQAARGMSLVECMNSSDALISDVCGVVSDYLFSGKPYAVTDMVDDGERFATSFPLSRAGYVLRSDLSNVDEVLDLLLGQDPLAGARRQLRTAYLGDFPADDYAEAFLAEARRQVRGEVVVPAQLSPAGEASAGDSVTPHSR